MPGAGAGNGLGPVLTASGSLPAAGGLMPVTGGLMPAVATDTGGGDWCRRLADWCRRPAVWCPNCDHPFK